MKGPLSCVILALAGNTLWAGCVCSGRVVDPSGKPVPDARIALRSPVRTTLGATRSGASGLFTIETEACGPALLSVAHAGFADRTLAVRLDTAAADLTVALSLTPVEEHVTVTAEADGVSMAGETAQRVNSLPRSVLAERGRTVLTEVAAGEPGVQEQRTSPQMGGFFVRGLTGRGVAVYRDGFRYTTAAQRGGVSTFQNLVDTAALDSVEILRGPASAQYGSDALGGTINLLSAFPLDASRHWSAEATAMADYASALTGTSVLAAARTGRLDLTITGAARRMGDVRTAGRLDGHAAVTRFLGLPSTVAAPGRQPETGFTQYGGSAHAQVRITGASHLQFHYERGQQDGGSRYDQLLGGDGNLIASLRNLMMDFGYLKFQRMNWAGFSQVSAGGSYTAQREERVNQGGNGNPRGGITHQYERIAVLGATLSASRHWRGHALALGGDLYRERMRSPAFTTNPVTGGVFSSRPRVPDGATYLTSGAYLQDAWRVTSRLRLSGAVRAGGATYKSLLATPTDSLTANAVTGRAGAVMRLAGPVSVHAQYARGFRAPGMTDLGTLGLQGNGSYEANVNDLAGRGAIVGTRADDQASASGFAVARLRPETSNNIEGGVQVESQRLRLEVTAFRMDLRDSIVSQTLLLPQGAVGQFLGGERVVRQLPSGAVYVDAATNPVLVRANYLGARLAGIEQAVRLRLTPTLTFNQNFTSIRAHAAGSSLPPDIEPGVPPATAHASLLYTRRRLWLEPYATVAWRQTRLSSLALADRRVGASRSRANIAAFFNNGARARGLVVDGRLQATGETLEQVQTRVLGPLNSAPLFPEIPGYGLAGIRLGVPLGEQSDLFVDASNLADKRHRGIGWGIDGAGRSVTVKYRVRF